MVVRLGIIGTGLAARHLHWPALKDQTDRFEIVALANRTREKAEAFADVIGETPFITADYRELLARPDVDAVDIAAPIALNAPLTRDALHAGKHVLLEKPVAADIEAARAVVEDAERHPDLVLLVAENIRYERRVQRARALVDDGRIGRVVMLHLDVLAPHSPDSPYTSTAWRAHPEHIGGYLSDGGVHQTAMLHMLGGPVSEVEGLVTTFDAERDPTDTLVANLRFRSGAVGHLTYSVGVPRYQPAVLQVFGTEGSLAVHHDHISLSTGSGDEEIPEGGRPNGYDREFADFYRAITEGTPPEVQPRDALADLAVIDAILRSAAENRVVELG